jgi:hypothetical protein
MIRISQYNSYIFDDLELIFKQTNMQFYSYSLEIGMEINLSNKNQKTIYTHFFIKQLCQRIQTIKEKVIFFINEFSLCEIHKQIIKKIKKIFGFRIWIAPYSLNVFRQLLSEKDSKVVEEFELFLNVDRSLKSFRQIKKYLEKEGFTNLSDSYFQDITNKMLIVC